MRDGKRNADEPDGTDGTREARGASRRSFLRAAVVGAGGVGLTALAGDADATVVPPVRAVGRDGTELLRTERTAVGTDAGDSATTATVTSLGESVSGRLDGDEEDWYAFDVSSDRRLRVELDRTTEGVAAVSLYDPSGGFLDMMHVDDGSGALEAESDGSADTWSG